MPKPLRRSSTRLASATTAMPTTSTSNPLVTITVPRSATIRVTKRPSTSSWDRRCAACARVARLPASTTATASHRQKPKSSELPAFPVVRSTVANPTVHGGGSYEHYWHLFYRLDRRSDRALYQANKNDANNAHTSL